MNHVGLVGRITKDPELRYYNEKRPYSVFTLAVNRNYKSTQGNVEADFIQCVAWGKLAETVTKYCGKGSMIGVNGRLNTRTYVNHENKRMYSVDVVAEDVRFYKLKNPASTMDLSQFEQPAEQSASQTTYSEGEVTNRPSETNHSVVAESGVTQENNEKLPIPN